MANSYVDFLTPTTAQQEFDNLTLDYVSTNDFYLTITNGETKTTYNASDSSAKITVSTSPTLKVTITDSAVYNTIVGTSSVRIGRSTDVASPERTFTDGSTLKASDLNTSFKQVLFGIQEQVDGGLGSLPVDTDDKYDAGNKVIKNLKAPINSLDAVNLDYVTSLALTGSGVPQNWSFTTASGDLTNGNADRAYTLSDPVATSTNDLFYLVEVGGVVQTPDAYNVAESSGVYTLTLVGGGSIDDGVAVSIRNWGISRNEVEQPIKQESNSSVALTVKNISDATEATADLIQLQEHDGTTLGRWKEDGELKVDKLSALTTDGDLSLESGLKINTDKFTVNYADGLTKIAGALWTEGSESMGIKGIHTRSTDLNHAVTRNIDNALTSVGYELTGENSEFIHTGNRVVITPSAGTTHIIFFTNIAVRGRPGFRLLKNATSDGINGSAVTAGTDISNINGDTSAGGFWVIESDAVAWSARPFSNVLVYPVPADEIGVELKFDWVAGMMQGVASYSGANSAEGDNQTWSTFCAVSIG